MMGGHIFNHVFVKKKSETPKDGKHRILKTNTADEWDFNRQVVKLAISRARDRGGSNELD